jgi:hypothetical protein
MRRVHKIRLSAVKKQRRYAFDPLEREYSYRRLSGIAYATANIYRSILEQAADRSVSRPATEYHTTLFLKDAALVGAITNRELAIEHRKFVRSQLGADARRILELLLLGKASFATIAAARGYAGDWGRKKIGRDFREACEDLARVYTARWPEVSWPQMN